MSNKKIINAEAPSDKVETIVIAENIHEIIENKAPVLQTAKTYITELFKEKLMEVHKECELSNDWKTHVSRTLGNLLIKNEATKIKGLRVIEYALRHDKNALRKGIKLEGDVLPKKYTIEVVPQFTVDTDGESLKSKAEGNELEITKATQNESELSIDYTDENSFNESIESLFNVLKVYVNDTIESVNDYINNLSSLR